ncbi:hypothetical protein [Acetobacter estunensis]|uniref:hypothetical protein n=1 Tax=Acetobacter estunensis TaxID=104097 RepID=UPI001C2D173C|nr:hypothetical protein [Acetobacter estunensis]MBV1838034.1 hypothetical protein [Acetobacter estunensis]
MARASEIGPGAARLMPRFLRRGQNLHDGTGGKVSALRRGAFVSPAPSMDRHASSLILRTGVRRISSTSERPKKVGFHELGRVSLVSEKRARQSFSLTSFVHRKTHAQRMEHFPVRAIGNLRPATFSTDRMLHAHIPHMSETKGGIKERSEAVITPKASISRAIRTSSNMIPSEKNKQSYILPHPQNSSRRASIEARFIRKSIPNGGVDSVMGQSRKQKDALLPSFGERMNSHESTMPHFGRTSRPDAPSHSSPFPSSSPRQNGLVAAVRSPSPFMPKKISDLSSFRSSEHGQTMKDHQPHTDLRRMMMTELQAILSAPPTMSPLSWVQATPSYPGFHI